MDGAQANAEAATSRKLVLVVEDDPTIGELIKDVINTEADYQARLVINGADALEVLRQVKVSLVILDINLPGISGYEMHDKLCSSAQYGSPVVLFMSAGAKAKEAKSKGAKHFLAKPFELDELLRLVGELAG